MVVFLHSYNPRIHRVSGATVNKADSAAFFVENIISQGITRIAVPFFFIVSGYLFFQNIDGSAAKFKKKVIKRCRTLLLPFLFWSTSVFIVIYIAQLIPAAGDFSAREPIRNYTLFHVLRTIFIFPIPFQLWFIRDLFVFVLLSPVIYYALNTGGKTVVLCLGIAWLFVMPLEWYGGLFFFVTRNGPSFIVKSDWFGAFFFFVTGGFIALSKIGLRQTRLNPRWLILLWLGIVFIRSYFFTCKGAEMLWLYKSGILVGLTAFWFNYDLYGSFFEHQRIFRFTHLTFFVYAAHEPMLTIFLKLWAKLFHLSEISAFAGYFVCPMLVLLICLFLGTFIKRYCSGLFQVMTGWR